MNMKQRIVVIIADIVLLAALTYSIYIAQQTPQEIAFAFMKAFIPMVIVTLVLGRIFIKKFRTADADATDSNPALQNNGTDFHLFG
ncbi:MAG: hypothetical protein V2B19_17770 [Pseudomonadota bacterium]